MSNADISMTLLDLDVDFVLICLDITVFLLRLALEILPSETSLNITASTRMSVDLHTAASCVAPLQPLAAIEEILRASNLHTRPLDKSEGTWLLYLDCHTLISKVDSHDASNESS